MGWKIEKVFTNNDIDGRGEDECPIKITGDSVTDILTFSRESIDDGDRPEDPCIVMTVECLQGIVDFLTLRKILMPSKPEN